MVRPLFGLATEGDCENEIGSGAEPVLACETAALPPGAAEQDDREHGGGGFGEECEEERQ